MKKFLLAATLATAAAGAALTTAPAQAATVTSRTECVAEGRVCGARISFDAAPGETNDVTVTHESGAFVVRDSTATITNASGCTLVDQHTARCETPPPFNAGVFAARLGDGDDSYDEDNSTNGTVNGGTGSDRLAALTVSYAGRTDPITVDLATGTGGAAGENDVLVRPGILKMGRGDDTVRGSAEDDNIYGGPGNDSLSGGPGMDSLYGERGVDSFDGGGGPDTLVTREPGGRPGPEQVVCGGDIDDVGSEVELYPFTDIPDIIAADCERLGVPGDENIRPTPSFTRTHAILRFETRCLCRMRVKLRVVRDGRSVFAGQGRARPNRHRLRLRLNRRGRRLLRRGAGDVRVQAVMPGNVGWTSDVTR